MSAGTPFGIPPEAMPAWHTLSSALDNMGRPPGVRDSSRRLRR
jgi:hypothetical protein